MVTYSFHLYSRSSHHYVQNIYSHVITQKLVLAWKIIVRSLRVHSSKTGFCVGECVENVSYF